MELTRKLAQMIAAHAELASSVAILVVAGIVSFVIQVAANRKAFAVSDVFAQWFPLKTLISPSFRTDVTMYVVSKLFRKIMVLGDVGVTLVLATAIKSALVAWFPQYTAGHAGLGAIIAWSVALFLLIDLGFYVTHYLDHKVGFMWEMHKVHHSASVLNPFTGWRTHPLSDKFRHLVTALLISLPAGAAMFLHGFSIPEIGVLIINGELIASILVLDALHHCPFPVSFGPLDHIFISPRVHQLHHSTVHEHWDHNFGLKLSVWDWMFGTLMLPAKGEVLVYGIGRGAAYDHRYDSLYGAYVRPSIDAVRVLFGRPVAELPPPQSLQDAGLKGQVSESRQTS